MKTLQLSPLGENRFPDIEGLKFYEAQGEQLCFDASGYLASLGTENRLSIEDFFVRFAYFVEVLCETLGIAREELSVTDDKGGIYLDECLTIPFLTYTQRWFGPWVFLRAEELLRFGFTVNDAMADYFHATRFAESTPVNPR